MHPAIPNPYILSFMNMIAIKAANTGSNENIIPAIVGVTFF
jgi:hypothetical protein